MGNVDTASAARGQCGEHGERAAMTNERADMVGATRGRYGRRRRRSAVPLDAKLAHLVNTKQNSMSLTGSGQGGCDHTSLNGAAAAMAHSTIAANDSNVQVW